MRWSAILCLGFGLSACATAPKDDFLIAHQPGGQPVAILTGYKGPDAQAFLSQKIRKYCGGEFEELEKFASPDGANHRLVFSCSAESTRGPPLLWPAYPISSIIIWC
jgi:hypothetical protein